MSYEDNIYFKLMLRDRRTVRSDHLLLGNRKIQVKQLQSSIKIALKKIVLYITAAMTKNFINKVVTNDNAFRFMSSITGSRA